MKNAMLVNDIQAIQKILEKYLKNRNVAKVVAGEIFGEMKGKTLHKHRGDVFFVHKDEKGKLVLTTESEVKAKVQAILNSYLLDEDKVKQCLEQLMAGHPTTEMEFETIEVPGSDSPIYAELMKYEPINKKEKIFKAHLKESIDASVEEFRVFVNDPSINKGKLQFVPNVSPAVGYSYNENKELAKRNGLRLGTPDEWFLFVGWFINRLIKEGSLVKNAWFAVCVDSSELGDIMNTYKMLEGDEYPDRIVLAGGSEYTSRRIRTLSDVYLGWHSWDDSWHTKDCVGWFVC